MPMASIERDLAVVFDTGVFGTEAVIYASGASSGRTVKGIFDDGDVAVSELGSNVETYARETKFQCATSDVLTVVANDVVVIEGTTYYVAYVITDGVGTTELFLSTELT